MSSANSTNDQLLLKVFFRDCFFVLIARAPSLLVYFSVVYFTGFTAIMMAAAPVQANTRAK
jgi:hypothetical protein